MVRTLLTPRMIAVHLVALLAVAATVTLGVWQYHVWGQHRADEAATLARAPIRPLTGVLGPDAPFPNDIVGQRVRLSGSWLPDGTVFVADRPLGDRTGYWVVTPVAVTGRSAMLVVRGWSPAPEAAPVSGEATVTGWLQPPEGSLVTDTDPTDDVLPQLRVADAIQHVDTDLYGAFVVSARPTQGLEAVGPPTLPAPSWFTGLRNLLYGLEWWVFAAFAAFVWVRWCRDEIAASRAVGSDSPRDPTAPEDASDDPVGSAT